MNDASVESTSDVLTGGWHDRRTAGTLPRLPRPAHGPSPHRPDGPPLVLRTARESDLPELRRLDEEVFQEVAYPGFLLRQLFDMCKKKSSSLAQEGDERLPARQDQIRIVGPAISVAYPQELLDEVDRAANRQQIARAAWLSRAAERALPHRNFDRADSIAPVLAEVGGWLDETHQEALDLEVPRGEREFRAAGYGECLTVVRDTLRQALDALDRHGANEAYKQAKAANPAETAERGAVWGRAVGTELAAGLLHGLLLALPSNAEDVKFRAELDDPNEDLD